MCHASMRGSLSSAGCHTPSAASRSRCARAAVASGQGSRPRRPVAVTRAMRVPGKASATSGWIRKTVMRCPALHLRGAGGDGPASGPPARGREITISTTERLNRTMKRPWRVNRTTAWSTPMLRVPADTRTHEDGGSVPEADEALRTLARNVRAARTRAGLSLDELVEARQGQQGRAGRAGEGSGQPELRHPRTSRRHARHLRVGSAGGTGRGPRPRGVGRRGHAAVGGERGSEARLMLTTSGPAPVEVWRWTLEPGEEYPSHPHQVEASWRP